MNGSSIYQLYQLRKQLHQPLRTIISQCIKFCFGSVDIQIYHKKKNISVKLSQGKYQPLAQEAQLFPQPYMDGSVTNPFQIQRHFAKGYNSGRELANAMSITKVFEKRYHDPLKLPRPPDKVA